MFADDVNTTGHHTTFPSSEQTVLLGLPLQNGRQPEHEVLHEGACTWADLVGDVFGAEMTLKASEKRFAFW